MISLVDDDLHCAGENMRASFASSDVLYGGSGLIFTSNVPTAFFIIDALLFLPTVFHENAV